MTPTEEYQFVAMLTSAMNRSDDGRELEKLWREYSVEIAALSPEGQKELHGLRARRSCELTEARRGV